MKKSILLLVFCVLLSLGFGKAQADESESLRRVVQEACIEGKPAFLKPYGIREEELETVFWELYNGGKLPWYVEREYRYTYEEGSGEIQMFTPGHLDPEEYDRKRYEQAVAEILDATVSEGMTDLQKALAIHDYLAANYSYDASYTCYWGYDLLVRGTAVCNGYAQAYMDLMNRVGVETVMVESEEMDHGWNMIKLNGNWYHVDVTWDDPSPDSAGTVGHRYFLKTDEQMLAGEPENHYGWESRITCTDESFTDVFWDGVESWICTDSADVFYLRRQQEGDTTIWARDALSGEETRLYREEEEYIDIGYGRYSYCRGLRGLSLWNDRLFFNTQTKVYSMATDGSDVKEEYVHDYRNAKTYIYGCQVEDGVLYMTLADHEFQCQEQSVTLSYENVHTHSYEETVTPPSCLEEGYTICVCSCGITFEIDRTPATGHSYDAGTVYKEESGRVRRYTCYSCGHTYEEDVPLLFVADEKMKGVLAVALHIAAVFAAVFVIRLITPKKKRKK